MCKIGDKRFERERNSVTGNRIPEKAMSSTFDAFQRMAAGIDSRTMVDKMSDPNRPTWEQYKKENEDKLDLVGLEMRKMVEYRAQLDAERDRRLANLINPDKKHAKNKDEDDENSDESGDDEGEDESYERSKKMRKNESESDNESKDHKKRNKEKSNKKKKSKKHKKHKDKEKEN
jgi:hypothetical protein